MIFGFLLGVLFLSFIGLTFKSESIARVCRYSRENKSDKKSLCFAVRLRRAVGRGGSRAEAGVPRVPGPPSDRCLSVRSTERQSHWVG